MKSNKKNKSTEYNKKLLEIIKRTATKSNLNSSVNS